MSEASPESVLAAMVADFGAEVAGVERLASKSREATRASYRVRLRGEGAGSLKARRFPLASDALRVETLLEALPPMHFPKCHSRRDEWLLLEWVEGRAHWGLDTAAALGDLLGQMHAAWVPQPSTRCVEVTAERLQKDLALGVDARVIDVDAATALARRALGARPESTDMGVVHLDLCAENVVWRPSGELASIDNELLGTGALDFDVARMFAASPMSAPEQEAARSAYGKHRTLEGFDRHAAFWTGAALAASFALRAALRAG